MPVALNVTPAGPKFEISQDGAMPVVDASATLTGVTIDAKTPPMFTWSATLAFDGSVTPHGAGRNTAHSPLVGQQGTGNTYRVPFTEVRGGVLTISVTVVVNGTTLTASSKDLTVVGTNPTPAAIKTLANAIGANKVRFRKQMRQESSLKQFTSAGWPLFSGDALGGVGLCQITRPAPTPDQTWDWRENVRAGWALYQEKERIARGYPAQVRAGATYRALVQAWNAQPSRAKLPPIAVALPEYTDDQLELDTIRGFNGFAGGLHEFRVRVDANGLLVATVDATGTAASAEWERVPVADRGTSGDPNYVANVEAQADF